MDWCSKDYRFASGYQIRRWKKKILRGNDLAFIQMVLEHAQEGKALKVKSKYYSCAKFIQKYYLARNFRYRTRKVRIESCCRSYPVACKDYPFKSNEMGCCDGYCPDRDDFLGDTDNFAARARRNPPRGHKNLDNCYNDCCERFSFIKRHVLWLEWLPVIAHGKSYKRKVELLLENYLPFDIHLNIARFLWSC